MLDLPIRLDLALQPDQFVGTLIDPAQHVQSLHTHHDQEHLDCEECRQQLVLNAGGYACNKVDQRACPSHYRSFMTLKRSRRNSSVSKRTPRYWTRRMLRRSTIEVRNECSMSPFAFLAA